MLGGIGNLSCLCLVKRKRERERKIKNGTKNEHIPDIIEPFKTHISQIVITNMFFICLLFIQRKNNNNHNNLIDKHAKGGRKHTGIQCCYVCRMQRIINKLMCYIQFGSK